jgi:exodeoxyribonuclease V gamma subunit
VLHIHRSMRADSLVGVFAALLAAPAEDPFAPEVVAVPSRGVERWLAQQFSHVLGAEADDGVCANVVFPLYPRLLDEAAAAADPSYARSIELWSAERSVWPLMKIIERCAPNEAWCRVLSAHLGLDGSGDKGRRFAVASMLARHFVSYGTARPNMLRAWYAGRDEQGDATMLADDVAWQAELWRRLRSEIGTPAPVELLDQACARLRQDASAVQLPEQFSIFGPTRISPARVQVLAALAQRRDVHLWLHHPSPALWQAVARSGSGSGRRRDDRTSILVHNPLLVSMSRDIRELQQLLTESSSAVVDVHHDIGPRPRTLLGRLQHELEQDIVATERTVIAPDDRSVQVLACHGPARQVEVIREAVLGLLAADATLEPRDVLIMCPNIEMFAPLVAASFGMADEPGGHPAARLRVRLADRSLRQTNPLLSLLSQLLELAANRVTATQLLDLASAAPVRRRFGFSDDDVERLRDWTTASGARWGLDAQHRKPYGLGNLVQGTWRAATDRLLLGVAMEEDEQWLGDALPLDDVDSGDIELAGRFAELVDRTDCAVRQLEQQRLVPEWARLLSEVVLSVGEPSEAWQLLQLRRELGEMAETAEAADAELGLPDITALLHSRLEGRPTRANFRTGTLTVCTLVPMRSVPHRVVCLLGMDDGAFPRQGVADGDDVLAREPRTGERDVRSEDRQLFLDAICAAQEHLVISYTGSNPRSGADVPPCVPLGELLDAVDATAEAPGGGRARDHVVVHHPLQPFDARNYAPATLGTAGPFSFDPSGLAGALAAARPREQVPPLVGAPLDAPAPSDTVNIDDLVRFLQHPARAFLRQRLGVTNSGRDEEPEDALPVALDGLQMWAIGDRVLRRRLAGTAPTICAQIEYLRGELPPGPLGRAAMKTIGAHVDALLRACQNERATEPSAVDVTVPLPDGRCLSGTVTGVRSNTLLGISYSRLAPKHRLAAWVRYLALVAGRPDGDWVSVAVGRRTGGVRRAELSGVDVATAERVLGELVQLRDAGLREPLPLAVETSALYTERRIRGADIVDAVPAARSRWESDTFGPENADPENVLVFGSHVTLSQLMAATPAALDGAGEPEEPSRFGVLARRVWTPLLNHETDVFT